MTTLEISEVTVEYGAVTAVEDISLSVASGEIVGLLGPNGAGKSTTLGVLLDYHRPTEGSVRIAGTDVQDDPAAVRDRVGVLPEGYDLYDRLTGYEHLAFAADLTGATVDADALLDRVGLDHADAERPVGTYSTGMGQRLVLAMALVGEPDLLVLDEPSAGLDPAGVRVLRRIVREEAQRGAAVLFSSHRLEEVEAVCDHVGVVHDGRLIAESTIEELRGSLGRGPTVSLTVADEAESGAVRTAVESVAGVAGVAAEDATLRVDCAESDARQRVIEAASTAGTLTDVSVEEASLEELFETLTGDAATAGDTDKDADPRTDDGMTDSGSAAGEVQA